jgi:aspartyl-tRNA(Asn)/glutamyl-tRNA(Gln) amidotransferase subunit B
MPEARRDRFVSQYGLSRYDAELLTSSRATADWFEEALGSAHTPARAKAVSNWILNDVFARLKESGAELAEAPIKPAQLLHLIELVEKGTITGRSAKEVFEEMFTYGKDPNLIVKEKGLEQMSDSNALSAIIDQVIAENPKAVADYKGGKSSTINFLIGGVMKATRGTANKDVVTQMLKEKLD